MAKQIANSTGAFGQDGTEPAQQPGTYDAVVAAGSAAIKEGDAVALLAVAGSTIPHVTLGGAADALGAGAANEPGVAGETISVVCNGVQSTPSAGLSAGDPVENGAAGIVQAVTTGKGVGAAIGATDAPTTGETVIWYNA